jgi:hypothetical protein
MAGNGRDYRWSIFRRRAGECVGRQFVTGDKRRYRASRKRQRAG